MDTYTLVRHSGYGYKGDPTFIYGLEVRQVSTKADSKVVAKAGGLLMNYADATNAADNWFTYRDNDGWILVPHALGNFSSLQIDQLDIYMPTAQDIGILIDHNVKFLFGNAGNLPFSSVK